MADLSTLSPEERQATRARIDAYNASYNAGSPDLSLLPEDLRQEVETAKGANVAVWGETVWGEETG